MLKIVSATLELTHTCNLRCTHCYNDSGPDRPRTDMGLPTLRALLDDLRICNQVPVIEFWLSGGEPVLHRQFVELAAMIHDEGHAVILASNGIFSEQLLERVIAAKQYLRRVHLSLEGLRESNDAIRGPGTFDQLVKGTIPMLKGAGMHVCVTVHLRRQNQTEIGGLAALVVDQLDCDLKLGVLRPLGRARQNLVGEMLSPAELVCCLREIYRLKAQHPRKRIWHDWDLLTEDTKFYSQDLHNCESCPAGRKVVFSCSPEFDIYPCAQLSAPSLRLGNLRNGSSISQLMSQPVAETIFRQLRSKRVECCSCRFYRVSCCGGCPAIPFGLAADPTGLGGMDPYCVAGFI